MHLFKYTVTSSEILHVSSVSMMHAASPWSNAALSELEPYAGLSGRDRLCFLRLLSSMQPQQFWEFFMLECWNEIQACRGLKIVCVYWNWRCSYLSWGSVAIASAFLKEVPLLFLLVFWNLLELDLVRIRILLFAQLFPKQPLVFFLDQNRFWILQNSTVS